MRRLSAIVLFAFALIPPVLADTLVPGGTGYYGYSSQSTQSYTVPAGTDYLVVKVWGAGGAEGVSTPGGGGAFVVATVNVSAGQVVTVVAGQGGGPGISYNGGWPGGGAAAGGGGAGGGGLSAAYNGNFDIVAGAGGGGGNGGSVNGVGGPGGYPNGANGGGPGVSFGLGGTQSAGGAGGTGNVGNGSAGSYLAGGNSNVNSQYIGGGGGSGYYGGGGGATGSTSGGGGGGGSSVAIGCSSVNFYSGSGSTPGGVSDPSYPGNSVGVGGNSGTYSAGNNGYVIIQAWSHSGPPVFSNLSDVTVNPLQTVSYSVPVQATPSLSSFSASGLPAGLSASSPGAVVSGAPTGGAIGTGAASSTPYSVTYTATNSAGTTQGVQRWNVPIPTFTVTPSFSSSYPNAGQTLSITITSTCGTGVAWTENKMWQPGQDVHGNPLGAYDLGNQYPNPPTSYPTTFVSQTLSYPIPSQTGTYTLQVRVADQWGNYQDFWYPFVVGEVAQSLPYTTGFDSYTAGNLFPQDNWLVWQGQANVMTSSAQTGAQSLRMEISSVPTQLTRVMKSFTSSATDVFVDFWARPAAAPGGSAVNSSSIIDLGSAQFGFLVTGTNQGTIYALDGNGSGSGTWTASGGNFPVDANGLSTSWIRITTEMNYTTNRWKTWINGSPIAASYGSVSNAVTSFSGLTFWGTSYSPWYIDTFSAGTTNPFVFTSPPTWPGTPVSSLWDTSFNITWNAAGSPYSPISNYQVVVYKGAVGGTLMGTYNTTGSSTSVSGLYPNTAYSVVVTATNLGNLSSTSTAYSITTLQDQTPPTIVTGLKVTGSTASTISLSWTPSWDLVGVTLYRVYRTGVASPVSNDAAQGTNTTFTDTGLTIGSTYTYSVYAYDARSNQSQAGVISATTGYLLSVTSGSAGSSTLSAGATTTITANAPPTGYLFQGWTVVSGGGTFGNAASSSTTFTIGSSNTVIQANYVLNSVGDADGDGIPNGVEQALGTNPTTATTQDSNNQNVQLDVQNPR